MSAEKLATSLSIDAGSPHATEDGHDFPPLTEHTYTSSHDEGTRTVVLNLFGRSKQPTAIPRVLASDGVRGSVGLSATKHFSVKSVSVEVVGTLSISVGTDARFVFLNIKRELWSHHTDGAKGTAKPGDAGSFSWPFSIEFPKTVHLKHGGLDEYPLPSSFLMARGRASINYRVTAIVKHGLLSSIDAAGTSIYYVPLIQAGAPSATRQLAYAEHQPLLGPDDDPDGWQTLEPVTVRGTVFGNREVAVNFKLSVALPLSYARGTSIPVWLVISSSDSQALDLISTATAPVVRLRRIIEDRYLLSSLEFGQTIDMTTATPTYQEKMYPDTVDYIQTAVWWPISLPSGTSADQGTRILQGEIHLRPFLPPTLHLGYFKCHYFVSLFPPTATGLTVHDAKETTVLQEISVELATIFADGPRHIAYSTVQYDRLPGEDGGPKPTLQSDSLGLVGTY